LGRFGDEIGGLYSKVFVATVAKELAEARMVVAQGLAADGEAYFQRIHERFTYRMILLEEGEEKARRRRGAGRPAWRTCFGPRGICDMTSL
jgi:hypothetical protein